tara:strand:+ start:304 stop:477 length:174 start_codon:yes stop_codon:yes gene_type:complete
MKYRFFSVNDKNKETVGTVTSDTLEEAYLAASKMKNLSLDAFKKLFTVEKMTRMFHS